MPMGITYFKRYRMQIELVGRDLTGPPVPAGYRFVPWGQTSPEQHAEAKYLSFRDEIDANVFPCLGEMAGCRRLMREISQKPGFLPEATWLAVCDSGETIGEPAGTIQGVRDRAGAGAVQNLGIVPGHRDIGLGTALLFCSLRGFRQAGVRRVHLEVTADNIGAVRLYRRLGFNSVKTVFRGAEVLCT